MPSNQHIPTGNAFAWRLATYYAALFAALGVQVPFLPVWFTAKGFDAASIGVVLAVPMAVRVIAIPVAARLADLHQALRLVIVVASLAAALVYGLLALAQAAGAIVAAYVLASAFYTPLMPLADAYALQGLVRERAGYGRVRLWGSAAFIFATLGGGAFLDLFASRDLIWLVVAATFATAAAAGALSPLPVHSGRAISRNQGPPLRDPRLFWIAIAAGLVQGSHAIYYGFSTIAWQAAGFSGPSIGGLWSIGVLAEIALFACSARWTESPLRLLFAGAAGAVVRWTAMALDPPAITLPFLQCLHALSFGATHLGSIGVFARLAAAQSGASAQGYLAVVVGLIMAACIAVSGLLYAELRMQAYFVMAAIAGLGGIICYAASGRVRRHRGN
ncbi:MAG: MFS transporter [Xanthobacteraceae bacterium]|jgi:PPP family 3-phenylpropionic acid transporter